VVDHSHLVDAVLHAVQPNATPSGFDRIACEAAIVVDWCAPDIELRPFDADSPELNQSTSVAVENRVSEAHPAIEVHGGDPRPFLLWHVPRREARNGDLPRRDLVTGWGP
jgi:hypothetical protein